MGAHFTFAIVLLAIDLVGLALMIAAFVLVFRQGGFELAMRRTKEEKRSVANRLMLTGASLGCVFAVLFCLFQIVR